MIDEDYNFWSFRCLSVHCVNDGDYNISLLVLILVCMANTCDSKLTYNIGRAGQILTVRLGHGELNEPKGRNSECRNLHFETSFGDLDVGFYGHERVMLLFSVPAGGCQ